MTDRKTLHVALFLAALCGIFLFSHFYQKAAYSKKNIILASESLNQHQDFSLPPKVQKTAEEYEVEAIRNAPTTDHAFFIEKLFSPKSNAIRKAAQTMLLQNFKEDATFVPSLLNYALDNRATEHYKNSLWRTSYILTRLPDHLLAEQESLIQDFFRAMFDANLVGKNTKMDMDSIVEKVIR